MHHMAGAFAMLFLESARNVFALLVAIPLSFSLVNFVVQTSLAPDQDQAAKSMGTILSLAML
jgi:hypothetical protein